jgi:hypothetical protein
MTNKMIVLPKKPTIMKTKNLTLAVLFLATVLLPVFSSAQQARQTTGTESALALYYSASAQSWEYSAFRQSSDGNTEDHGIFEVNCNISVTIIQSEIPIFCQGQGFLLSASVTGTPAISYEWSSGETGLAIFAGTSGTYSVTVTDDQGCTAVASINVSVSVPDLLSSFVMIAGKQINLEQTNVYSGGLGIQGNQNTDRIRAISGTNVTAGGTFARAQNITVTTGSSITNRYNTPASIALPPFEAAISGGSNIIVPDNTTVYLTDDLYKTIDIGVNSTLVFTNTLVDISRLKLGDGAVIKFTTCTKMHLNKLTAGKNVTINPEGLSVYFFIDGNVTFDEGAHVMGAFYLGTPNGQNPLKHTLDVGASTIIRPAIFRGMFLAEVINSGTNTYWYMNPYCNFCLPFIPKDLVVEETSFVAPANRPAFNNSPNPFSGKTTIIFTSPENNQVKLDVYDMSGKLIQNLYNGEVEKNREYKTEFDGSSLPAGIYIYKMTTNEEIFTGKMMLIKD